MRWAGTLPRSGESGAARGSQRRQARGPRIGEATAAAPSAAGRRARGDPIRQERAESESLPLAALGLPLPYFEEGEKVCKFRSARPGPEMKRTYLWVDGPYNRDSAQSQSFGMEHFFRKLKTMA